MNLLGTNRRVYLQTIGPVSTSVVSMGVIVCQASQMWNLNFKVVFTTQIVVSLEFYYVFLLVFCKEMVKTVEELRHFALICRELYGIKLPKLRGQTIPDYYVTCHKAGSSQCSLTCVIPRAIPPTFHVKNQRYLSHLPQCIT